MGAGNGGGGEERGKGQHAYKGPLNVLTLIIYFFAEKDAYRNFMISQEARVRELGNNIRNA